jgi:hypothetical protein
VTVATPLTLIPVYIRGDAPSPLPSPSIASLAASTRMR